MRKQFVNDSIGTLRTDSATFTIGLVCVVYILLALTFFRRWRWAPLQSI